MKDIIGGKSYQEKEYPLGDILSELVLEKINKVSGNTKSNVNIVQKTKSTNKKVNKIKPVKKKH